MVDSVTDVSGVPLTLVDEPRAGGKCASDERKHDFNSR